MIKKISGLQSNIFPAGLIQKFHGPLDEKGILEMFATVQQEDIGLKSSNLWGALPPDESPGLQKKIQ
jgi:hypothetical protein